MLNIKKTLTLLSMICLSNVMFGQQVIPLYNEIIPNSKVQINKNSQPSLEIYLPEKVKATGIGVLVIPGGAYQFLAYEEEGTIVAKAFAMRGITAFVLKYRLPNDATMIEKKYGPIEDAQQAIKIIRSRHKDWGIDSNKIGTIGFSAGGHLASMLGTKFNKEFIENLEHVSLRPDFMILVYPLISMDSKLTHISSRASLLGKRPIENQIWTFSSDKQVSFDTPPTYLTHTGDDQIVNVNNSIEMYKALVNNNIPAEMHLFPKGNHGFIQRLPVNEWLDPMLNWLQKGGFYTKPVSK